MPNKPKPSQKVIDKVRAIMVRTYKMGGASDEQAQHWADASIGIALDHGINPPKDLDDPAYDVVTDAATKAQADHEADTERLMRYWSEGEGAAKIRWGEPDDFYRCEAHLGKYVHGDELKGLCARLHHRAIGVWPGEEDGGRHSHKSGDADPKVEKFDPYEMRGANGRWIHGSGGHEAERTASEKTQQQAQKKAEHWYEQVSEAKQGDVDKDPRALWMGYQAPDDYQAINGVLRGNVKVEGAPPRARLAKTVHDMFDQAGTTTDKDMVLWRALRSDDQNDWKSKLKPGTTFTDKGIISTTAMGMDAEGWLALNPDGSINGAMHHGKVKVNTNPDDVVMEIHVPKGTRIVGGNPEFIETMLAPGSKFKITDSFTATSHSEDPLSDDDSKLPAFPYTRIVATMTKDGAAHGA